VQLYETYQNSQRSYLVLELAARGDLLEHINTASDQRCCPGLEEEEARRLFWQLAAGQRCGSLPQCRHCAPVRVPPGLPTCPSACPLEPRPSLTSPSPTET
jgi:hypothetical protein